MSSLSSNLTASSPLLPLASLETVDSMGVPSSLEELELGMRHTGSDAMGSTEHRDTNVPALMVAETRGEEGLVAFERSVYL